MVTQIPPFVILVLYRYWSPSTLTWLSTSLKTWTLLLITDQLFLLLYFSLRKMLRNCDHEPWHHRKLKNLQYWAWPKFLIRNVYHIILCIWMKLVPVRPLQDVQMKKMNKPIYTVLRNKRIRRCGAHYAPPPPIIFERLKLPQQIIYRRKGNLSESPNHLKYRKNILISRFYKQFSRSSRNLGHFGSWKKFRTYRTQTYHISSWSGWSGDSKYIICFAKYLNFAKFFNTFIKPRNLNFSRRKLLI